jgi:hypothetical protein
LGVTTIIPGVLPAEIGERGPRVSFTALTTYTPAKVLAVTLFETKARYARPLVLELLLEELPPQLSHIKLAGSRNTTRIRIKNLFKPWTPTSCGIIAWMQE